MARDGCTPCCCWNLKDGCITIGVWSLIYSIVQLAIFGWQTSEIKYQRDKSANWRLPSYGSYDPYAQHFPGYYERYYETDEERFYLGLLVVQIIKLVADFLLLGASVALVYGIHTSSKHLVWPWFPCMALSILTALAYCILWWAFTVNSYWIVLTVIEIITVIINVYCLVCVIIQYQRILKGKTFDYYVEDKPKEVIVYDTDYGYPTDGRIYYDYRGQPQYESKEPAIAESDRYAPSAVHVYGKYDAGDAGPLPKKQPLGNQAPSTVQEYVQESFVVSDRERLQPLPEEAEEYQETVAGAFEGYENQTFEGSLPGAKMEFTSEWLQGVETVGRADEIPRTYVQETMIEGSLREYTYPVDVALQTEFSNDLSSIHRLHAVSQLSADAKQRSERSERRRHHRGKHEGSSRRSESSGKLNLSESSNSSATDTSHDGKDSRRRTKSRSSSRRHREEERQAISDEDISKQDRDKHRHHHHHHRHHHRSRSREEHQREKEKAVQTTEDEKTRRRREQQERKRVAEKDEKEKRRTLKEIKQKEKSKREREKEDVKRALREEEAAARLSKSTEQLPTIQTPETTPPPRPATSSMEQLPQFIPPSGGSPPGTITIPQHIVIPDPSRFGADGRPRRYQINSEIVISYGQQPQLPLPIEASASGARPTSGTQSQQRPLPPSPQATNVNLGQMRSSAAPQTSAERADTGGVRDRSRATGAAQAQFQDATEI